MTCVKQTIKLIQANTCTVKHREREMARDMAKKEVCETRKKKKNTGH